MTHTNTHSAPSSSSPQGAGQVAGVAKCTPAPATTQSSKTANRTPLSKITREVFEPVWSNHNITTRQIAERLGVNCSSVCNLAKRLGLPPRGAIGPRKRVSDAMFARMWESGLRSRDIANVAGYSSVQAVSSKTTAMGLPKRERTKGAGAKAGTGRCGWPGSITLAQFHEAEMARRMREAAQ